MVEESASFSQSISMPLCAPGMGVNLWGESPPYVNPAKMLNILTKVLADGKGVANMALVGVGEDHAARELSVQ